MGKLKRGTVIKGKKLKKTGMKFYKVLSENMKHNDFQYVEGENTDIIPFNPHGTCEYGGLYFTEVNNILGFLDYGNHIREVTFADDEDVYIEDNKFKAHTITLGPAMMLSDIETWIEILKNINKYNSNYDDNIEKIIVFFCKNKAFDEIKTLITDKVAIEKNYYYIVKKAIDCNDNETAKLFLDRKLTNNNKNYYILDDITSKNNLELFKFVISKITIGYNWSEDYLLDLCIKNNATDCFNYLVSIGFKIKNTEFRRETFQKITIASTNKNIEIVKTLLSMCDKSIMNVYENDLLSIAISFDFMELITYLEENGILISNKNDYLLINAINHNNLEMIKFLVSKGIDPKKNNIEVVTAAIKTDNVEIIKYLAELDMDFTILSNYHFKSYDMVNYFLNERTDIEFDNALYIAIEYNMLDIVKKKFDKNKYSLNDLNESLIEAMTKRYYDIVKYIYSQY